MDPNQIGTNISDEEFQGLISPRSGIGPGQATAASIPIIEEEQGSPIGTTLTNEQFEGILTPPEQSSQWLKESGINFAKTPKRLAGIALGIVNSPLAFIWGSQTEQFRDPKEFAKLPFWKKQLVSAGAGFESAYKSMFKEGEWGTLYGDFYKAASGKTIEQDMVNEFRNIGVPDPERLASNLAPLAEMLGNIVADPLIIHGEASRIARLKIPKGWKGIIPKRMLDQINALDEAEKIPLQNRLLEVLKQRKESKDYINWWEKTGIPEIERRARMPKPEVKLKKPWQAIKPIKEEEMPEVLYKKGEELIRREKLPRLAKEMPLETQKGAAIGKEVERVGKLRAEVKKLPELELYSPSAKMTGKEKLRTEKFARLNKLQDLKSEGIEKVKIGERTVGIDAAIRQTEKSIGVGPLWEYRKAEKPLKQVTTLKSAGGAVFGIEEDEEGNISYSPAKGIAGTLLVAGGLKLKPSNVRKFAKTMKENPSWSKVVSGIGKESKPFSLPGLISNINVKLFDRFAKLKKVAPRAYEAARTFSSYKDQAMLKFIELQKAFKPIRKSEFEVTSYIKAHRDLSRASRGLKNPGDVGLADAQQAIKEIETHWVKSGKKLKDLQDARDLWNQWTHDHILSEALDNGIITEKAYADILKNNKWYATYDVLDYVPENIHDIPLMSSKEYFSVANQKIIKGMKGTIRQIDDPIEATIRKFGQAQATFAKNKVASIFVEDPNVQGIIRKLTPEEFTRGGWNKKEFDTINRFKDGMVERYLVPREIADAMKQLNPWQAPRIVMAYNSIFRAAATTLSPAFAIGNAARDAFMAYCASPVFKTKDILGRFQKQWIKGAWEGIKFEFLSKPSLVDDYVKAGGGFGYAGAEAFEKGVGKTVAKKMLFKRTPLRLGIDIVKSPLTLMEKINSIIELAPRIGNFDMAMKLGYTPKDAAIVGRQATIDFNRGGVWAKAVNQFVPFLNARIQARVVLAEAFKRDLKGTMAKITVSTVLPGMATYAWNRLYYSDLYDDIPEYVKQNYFIFIYGKEKDEKGRIIPKYFVIAKGDTGQMAWNPIEFGLDQEYKKDKEKILNFCINYLSDISPVEFARKGEVSISKAAGGLLPPMVKAPLEHWGNLKFYQGTEVVPYFMGRQKPPELQYKDMTPESYKWLGKKLKISPLVLQNYAGNIIAGYGREGFSPTAMLRGIEGRIIKTQGGEIENRAFVTIKDIEQGYMTVRANAEELIKNGQQGNAFRLMNSWNSGLINQINEFNKEFGAYGIMDRGGLRKSYYFTPLKKRNLIRSRLREQEMSRLEQRLRRR